MSSSSAKKRHFHFFLSRRDLSLPFLFSCPGWDGVWEQTSSLVLIWGGKASSLTRKYDVSCRFFCKCSLSSRGSSRLFLVCWEFLSEWMLDFVKCFFCVYWDNHNCFSFSLLVWWTELIKFWMLNQPWILGLNCDVLRFVYIVGFSWVDLFRILHLCVWEIFSAFFSGNFLSDFCVRILLAS